MKRLQEYILEKFKIKKDIKIDEDKLKSLIYEIHQVLCTKKPNSNDKYCDDFDTLTSIKDGPFENIYQHYGEDMFMIVTNALSITSEKSNFIYDRFIRFMRNKSWTEDEIIELLEDLKIKMQEKDIWIDK